MTHQKLLENQEHFKFGKNWQHFLYHMNDDRIQEAIKSLKEAFHCDTLEGKTFLDVGSGSGLFSLAAHLLKATVYSFDYDEDSVNCTRYLKETYGQEGSWTIEQGSILDQTFLKKFHQVDIVYSWGVLHHTGHMWQAFDHISQCVKDNGYLFISIYNDQGDASRRWLWLKKKYMKGSHITRYLLTLYTLIRQWTLTFIKDTIRFCHPLKSWNAYGRDRGMSPWYDCVDWAGGYPFEVAKPEEVFHFFKHKNFQLDFMKTCAGGLGCNEFIFKKTPA